MTHATNRNTGSDMDTVKESAVAVKDAVTDLASDAGKYASARISDAKEMASDAVEAAKCKAADMNTSIIAYIKKNPYRAVGIAAGAGLVLGFLLRRR